MNSVPSTIEAHQVDINRPGMTSPNFSADVEAAPLWSTEDVARYLGCTTRHVARLRDKGLPVIRAGNLVRFMPCRVIEWLDSRSDSPPQP